MELHKFLQYKQRVRIKDFTNTRTLPLTLCRSRQYGNKHVDLDNMATDIYPEKLSRRKRSNYFCFLYRYNVHISI